MPIFASTPMERRLFATRPLEISGSSVMTYACHVCSRSPASEGASTPDTVESRSR